MEGTLYQTDRESLERDTDAEFVRASGPGGQHRNKVESGVRLTHRSTGIVVQATERRSQVQNREIAFERLAQKLEEMQKPEVPRVATKVPRAQKRKRLEGKRIHSEKKRLRQSLKPE